MTDTLTALDAQRTRIAAHLEAEADRRSAKGHRHVARAMRIMADEVKNRFDEADEPQLSDYSGDGK